MGRKVELTEFPCCDGTAETGQKFDHGKTRPSLVYYSLIEQLSLVRLHGANKYGSLNNWRYLADGRERYTDAIMRHIFSYAEGKTVDDDSGLSILAHIATNVMFLIEGDLNNGYKEGSHNEDN